MHGGEHRDLAQCLDSVKKIILEKKHALYVYYIDYIHVIYTFLSYIIQTLCRVPEVRRGNKWQKYSSHPNSLTPGCHIDFVRICVTIILNNILHLYLVLANLGRKYQLKTCMKNKLTTCAEHNLFLILCA